MVFEPERTRLPIMGDWISKLAEDIELIPFSNWGDEVL